MRTIFKRIAAVGAGVVLLAGTALGASASVDNGNHGSHPETDKRVYVCFNDKDSSKNYIEYAGAPNGCAGHPGYSQWILEGDKAGIDDVSNTPGNTGFVVSYLDGRKQTINFPTPQQGAPGAPGQSAVFQTSGSTVVTNWAETSGWASDDFTRAATITRQHAAPSAKCGSDAGNCWFYTATLKDDGSFTTVPNHASPNPSKHENTAATAVTGDIHGVAQVEFYANNDTPNGASLPVSVNGRSSVSVGTSDWVSQAFPSGTKFSAFDLPRYTWVYSASGANAEQWTDSVGPGDDGSGAGDGDITGAAAS